MGLQQSTIVNYSSAIAFHHKLAFNCDPTATFKVQKFLIGAKNLRPPSVKLQPVSIVILSDLIKALLLANLPIYTTSILRSMMTLLYWGCLRIGEIAVSSHADHVIGADQVSILPATLTRPRAISIVFHSYKHSKGDLPTVRVSAQHDTLVCPVTALDNYLAMRPPATSLALFRHLLGPTITRAFFVSHLHRLLKATQFRGLNINSHSFRIGRTTDLVIKGASDAYIQKAGRWSSDAYKKYVRPQTITL